MEAFLDDLRHRGYEIEDRADHVWFAQHDELPAMFIVAGSGGFLFRAYFGGVQTALGESPLKQANRLNVGAVASRFFLDEDDDLVVEAWHPHGYDSTAFDAFLTAWLQDIGAMLDEHRSAGRSFDA